MNRRDQNILYAVLAISILALLGFVGTILYLVLKKKPAPTTTTVAAPMGNTVLDPSGRLLQTAFPVEPSCQVPCDATRLNHMCYSPGQPPQYCVADASGTPAWTFTAPQGNAIVAVGSGGSAGSALNVLSNSPAGTVVVGGPDTFLAPNYAKNNEMWYYWRGSDNLLYWYLIGRGNDPISGPFADCNPWQTSDGTCKRCTDS
jgi:hypothetical protein